MRPLFSRPRKSAVEPSARRADATSGPDSKAAAGNRTLRETVAFAPDPDLLARLAAAIGLRAVKACVAGQTVGASDRRRQTRPFYVSDARHAKMDRPIPQSQEGATRLSGLLLRIGARPDSQDVSDGRDAAVDGLGARLGATPFSCRRRPNEMRPRARQLRSGRRLRLAAVVDPVVT